MHDEQQVRRRYQNAVNNAQGQHFEGYIKAGCGYYLHNNKAKVEKIAEPFRVTEKSRDGKFTGRFTANAEPDFQGTLQGGRSIVFEAKYTTTDRMKRNVLTAEQMKSLEYHSSMGALAAVCIGIQDKFYFIPWFIWRDMKARFGRQYITPADVELYRVRFTGAVLFLDYVHGGAQFWLKSKHWKYINPEEDYEGGNADETAKAEDGEDNNSRDKANGV